MESPAIEIQVNNDDDDDEEEDEVVIRQVFLKFSKTYEFHLRIAIRILIWFWFGKKIMERLMKESRTYRVFNK